MMVIIVINGFSSAWPLWTSKLSNQVVRTEKPGALCASAAEVNTAPSLGDPV
jgi:hypothetical protein